MYFLPAIFILQCLCNVLCCICIMWVTLVSSLHRGGHGGCRSLSDALFPSTLVVSN
ncbi:inter alpha-trypsin inhibitor, heavy chain 4-like [Iris pallida]|uniref:Inter alpha-trypsin inhibitor, heavy chain 4-like n=1 Tax=Iris pallida TaxID=29817 RepID=A0AAX6FKX3_IRIPA|nr:inter alpha-trypsin inhibitor, heavy chain 4-like [Iris pallida]